MRHPVLNRIKQFMKSEPVSLVPGRDQVLAGVSGGADSVCLMLALKELGYEVTAVHVEHGIRGEESLEDGAYVRKLCMERGIEFHAVSVDVPSKAREEALSLEEAARLARWDVLRDVSDRLGIRVIATAHHRQDQAETVLWNLIRGSSLGGLGGIREVRREGERLIIRPLLECERDQIEDYLRQRDISWRTDSTNLDPSFTRNAIRLKVMPLLEQLNPEAALHIAQAASDLRQVEDLLSERTEQAYQDVILEDGDGMDTDLTADRRALSCCPDAIRTRVIRRMIARCLGGEKDITRAHIDAVNYLVTGESGHEVCLPDGLRVLSEEGVLHLMRRRIPKTEKIVTLDHDGVYFFSAGLNPFPEESPIDEELPVKGLTKEEPSIQNLADEETVIDNLPESELSAESLSGEDSGGISRDKEYRLCLNVSFFSYQGGEVPKKKYTKYLAYDTMAPCPVLRTRRDGDYLIVNSSSGRKKLKDYLIDEKVPRLRRDHIPLIAQGSHILWVIGMRISEGAKVRDKAEAMKVVVSMGSKEEA